MAAVMGINIGSQRSLEEEGEGKGEKKEEKNDRGEEHREVTYMIVFEHLK